MDKCTYDFKVFNDKSIKKCKVKNCFKIGKSKYNGYCTTHSHHIYRYGKIIDRTVFTRNEYVKYDDYAEIVLYDKQNTEICRAKIDLDDISKCYPYKWALNGNGCCICNSCRLFLHNHIMNHVTSNLVCDHINHDRLDNRKSNLRIITRSENNFNKNTKAKGYRYDIVSKKYIAYIKINRFNKHLGCFNTKEEAIKARKDAEEYYFPNIKYEKEKVNTKNSIRRFSYSFR